MKVLSFGDCFEIIEPGNQAQNIRSACRDFVEIPEKTFRHTVDIAVFGENIHTVELGDERTSPEHPGHLSSDPRENF